MDELCMPMIFLVRLGIFFSKEGYFGYPEQGIPVDDLYRVRTPDDREQRRLIGRFFFCFPCPRMLVFVNPLLLDLWRRGKENLHYMPHGGEEKELSRP